MKKLIITFSIISIWAGLCLAGSDEDMQRMRSEVSEELVRVKTISEEVKWRVDEANKRSEILERELASLKSQIIENNKVIEQKLTELSNAVSSVDTKRNNGEEELNKKIQLILDEVGKESGRTRSKADKKSGGASAGKRTEVKPALEKDSVAAEGTHTVGEGETLTRIAKSYGLSVKELMELNGIENANSVRIGQKLKVPKKSSE